MHTSMQVQQIILFPLLHTPHRAPRLHPIPSAILPTSSSHPILHIPIPSHPIPHPHPHPPSPPPPLPFPPALSPCPYSTSVVMEYTSIEHEK